MTTASIMIRGVNMGKFMFPGINLPPEDFLHSFFDVHEKVCLRVFSDRPGSVFSGLKTDCVLEGFSDVADLLKMHNDQNRGIFFVVNHGGHEDSTINRINAHFCEIDDVPIEEQLKRVNDFPLEPSLAVQTRKSLHCYWLMKDAKVERFRHIQKKLIRQFGADPACVNESRVFRLPGFNHCKEEPILVRCVKYNPELRYTQEQLEEFLPDIPEEPVPGAPGGPAGPTRQDRGTQKGLVPVGRNCAFIQHCKKNAKTLKEPDWYAMITNLAVFEGGNDVIHKLSRPYPKYSAEQTQAKIDHFHKSGTKPMTCAKIAERGFVCPKMKNGSCTCRSPAALAFRPMEAKELKKALAGQKCKNDAFVDFQKAQKFVNDYLYNQDLGLAETFIQYDVRQHFNLKSADARRLCVVYREANKLFTEASAPHREREPGGLEPWYERTKTGGLRFMPGVLAEHLTKHKHAFYCTEQYYFYENGVYTSRADKDAKAYVKNKMRPRECLTSQINDAEYQWQLSIRKSAKEINPNQYVINCRNGLYNVQTDELEPHDPSYYSTVQMKANYDPDAKCPRWMEFLRSVLEEPEINLLQEMFGYFLVPVTKAQKSFILCGLPNVGKSKILQTLQDIILGAENVSNIPLQNLSDRFQPAELFGKMANIYADLSDKHMDDAGMFKAVTGEDYITGERKHKDPFSFKPHARFASSCNELFRNFGDRSEAFYRRLIIIRFSKAVPDEMRDLHLFDKLQMEGDGILAWAIEGLKRLIECNWIFNETDRTRAEVHQYKIANSSVLSFVMDCCAVESNAVCYRKELYAEYQNYCSDSGIKGVVGQPRFNTDIGGVSGVTLADENVTRRAVFKGIRLAS